MTSPLSPLPGYRRHRLLWWAGLLLASVFVGLFIGSFFLDDIIRARTQATMNQKLKGYHVALGHAHLQLVGGGLTLSDIKIILRAHPRPPIADIAVMRFHIEWKELLSRRVVADLLLVFQIKSAKW
jgi:hypothetical protein